MNPVIGPHGLGVLLAGVMRGLGLQQQAGSSRSPSPPTARGFCS